MSAYAERFPLRKPAHGEWEEVAWDQVHRHDVVLGIDGEEWEVAQLPGDGTVILNREGRDQVKSRRRRFLRRLDA